MGLKVVQTATFKVLKNHFLIGFGRFCSDQSVESEQRYYKVKLPALAVQPMDNLSQGSDLGLDGAPSVKKSRTDSETCEFWVDSFELVEGCLAGLCTHFVLCTYVTKEHIK